jgi:hypothetical protein
MNPSLTRELMMARQQDELRAAANRRLVAEAKQARKAGRPAPGTMLPTPTTQVARPVRVPQLLKLLARLLPA